MAYGLATLNGHVTIALGGLAAAIVAWSVLRRTDLAPWLVTLALAAVMGLGVGLLDRRARIVATIVVVLAALLETPPLSGRSPMVLEAQWDRPRMLERRHVTDCLLAHYDDNPRGPW